MNKNILIGVVAVIILGGIVIYAVNRNPAVETPPDTTPTVVQTDTTPPVAIPKPGAPIVTTATVVSPTASTAVVNGKVYPNGSFTSYWFEYGTTPDNTSRSSAQIIGSGYVNIPTPAYITGLTANTKYYFRLVAENSYGKVAGVQYAFQTTLTTPPAQGNAPTTKTTPATAIERATANVNGTINENGSYSTFWFEYGDSANLGSVTALQSISGEGTLSVSASLSDLRAQTKYWFRLNAQNQYGTVNGAIMTFTTKSPIASASKPTVNTDPATNLKATTAQINGRINPNGAQTSYKFEYSRDSLLGSIIGTTTATSQIPAGTALVSVSADLSGLVKDTRYYVRLTAENSQGIVKGDIENFKTSK